MKESSEYRLALPLTVTEEESTTRNEAAGGSNYELIAPTQSRDRLIFPEVRVRHARTWGADIESNEDLRLRNRVELI